MSTASTTTAPAPRTHDDAIQLDGFPHDRFGNVDGNRDAPARASRATSPGHPRLATAEPHAARPRAIYCTLTPSSTTRQPACHGWHPAGDRPAPGGAAPSASSAGLRRRQAVRRAAREGD